MNRLQFGAQQQENAMLVPSQRDILGSQALRACGARAPRTERCCQPVVGTSRARVYSASQTSMAR